MTAKVIRAFTGAACLVIVAAMWKFWLLPPVSTKFQWLGLSLAIFAFLGALSVFLWRMWHHSKTARFQSRVPMSFNDFYREFYAQSGLPENVVSELLQEVADSIEVPFGLMRPQDSFTSELADLKGMETFDGGLAELTFAAKRRELKFGVHVDLTRIGTLDDYIRTFGQLEIEMSAKP